MAFTMAWSNGFFSFLVKVRKQWPSTRITGYIPSGMTV